MLLLRLVLANIKSKKLYAAVSLVCITLAACTISACCGFFFSAFNTNDVQSRNVFVFLVLLVSLLAVFIMRSVFAVNLGERTKTLGLLISLGMTRLKASLTLLIENLIYGVIGTALGFFLGRSFAESYVSFYDSQMQIYLYDLYGEYYGTDIAIRHIEFDSSATVAVLTIAVCLFALISATVTPVLRVYSISPSESSKGVERINISEREGIIERICKRGFGYIGRLSAASYINYAPRIRAVSLSLSLCSILVVAIYSVFMMRSWSNGEYNPLKADPLALTSIWMGISLTLISLVSAAMSSVANIKSRTRMLALLKSAGMSQRDIKKMTLVESLIIYSLSSIFGLLGSFLAVTVFHIIAKADGDNTRFYYPLALIGVFALLYLGFCTFYALYYLKIAQRIKIASEMK